MTTRNSHDVISLRLVYCCVSILPLRGDPHGCPYEDGIATDGGDVFESILNDRGKKGLAILKSQTLSLAVNSGMLGSFMMLSIRCVCHAVSTIIVCESLNAYMKKPYRKRYADELTISLDTNAAVCFQQDHHKERRVV